MNKKVFVGLSGGVDSAVSAALLKREGFEVTGVFITIAISGYPCPAAEDRISAMRVAAHLGIPFREIDLSKEYESEVFKPSLKEWEQGRTPNPDTLCNEKIKFGIFFDYCIAHGADFVATGHYARTSSEPATLAPVHARSAGSDFVNLLTAADVHKDQTYFLWAVPQEKLEKTLFPIGDLQKSEVRAFAKKFALPNALRPDSQGLCFLGPINLEDMIEHELPQKPGKVLDEDGEEVGAHKGTAHYTEGQRHGFTLYATSPETLPHYVIGKDVTANTITVSVSRVPKGVSKTHVILTHTNWIGGVESGECMVRYRYRQTLIPATLSLAQNEVILHEPHIVPRGQSLVLYKGERCLGGGVIADVTLI
jgi:tRNA-specific 2-thiouridylase